MRIATNNLPHGRRTDPAVIACTTPAQRLACPNMQPTGWNDGNVEHVQCAACGQGQYVPLARAAQ